MKKLILLILVMMFALMVSCEDDCDCNDPENQSIVGMWERTATDNDGLSFEVLILFDENGDYAFILEDPVEGHTNSYAEYNVTDDILTIFNDSDCEGDGIYNYSISGDMLTLTATDDSCDPRKLMLEGVWELSQGVK